MVNLAYASWVTPESDRFIRENYGTKGGLSCSEMAEKFGTTRNAIIGRARRLGLGDTKPRQIPDNKPHGEALIRKTETIPDPLAVGLERSKRSRRVPHFGADEPKPPKRVKPLASQARSGRCTADRGSQHDRSTLRSDQRLLFRPA